MVVTGYFCQEGKFRQLVLSIMSAITTIFSDSESANLQAENAEGNLRVTGNLGVIFSFFVAMEVNELKETA